MQRLMLLALGLSALLWTGAARTDPVPSDNVMTMSGAGASLTGDSQGPGDSNRQWRVGPQAIAAVTESAWKSALVHAELAGTPSAPPFDTRPALSPRDHPARSAPHYLRHTPLLI